MDYNRLTINLIKNSFAQYVATGTVNETALTDGISQLNKAIDKAIIANEDTSNLEDLKKDLQNIKYEML